MKLFSELKRRNVLRVVAAYIAVSWLLIQVVETLFPVFGLSDAAIRGVVIVLAIGFVPIVVITWAFDLTPDGLVRDSEVDHDSPAAKAGSKRLDRIVMVALALAVGFFAFDKFMLSPAREQMIAEVAKEEGRAEAAQESRNSGTPMLAVLPFSAVTETDDSRFFAAGIHDDLLTKLAKLPSMLVISRTSVLEYKDVQRNIREIGEALGADAILEGGVQSAGNRIRINAQLIDARTDEHLWAETYDRELTATNIFDVQDEIARAISEALKVTLDTSTQEGVIPTSNMAAYRAYHQALIARETVTGKYTSPEYRELLQEAADLDPAFTRPMVLLVGSYGLEAFSFDDPGLIKKAEAVLEKIQDVAPDSTDFLTAQTYYAYYILRDYGLGLQIANRALEITPSDTHLIAITSWIKRRQGDHAGSVDAARRARTLEPGNDIWTQRIVRQLFLMHEYDEALAEIEAFEGRNYFMEQIRATLAVREHGDLGRLAMETESLADEMGDGTYVWDVWAMHLNARNFEKAVVALDAIPGRPKTVSAENGISGRQALLIETAWGMGDAENLAKHVADARQTLGTVGTTDEPLSMNAALSLALLAAVEGKTEETEQHVRSWFRVSEQDLIEKAMNWPLACQPLGVAGAADAAVACIREGLEQPSAVLPFIEPHLPHYDPIRAEPVFVGLVQDLGG